MDGEPLVSIVTPSFNQARFIEENILSVLEQGYPAVQHIVVDGGSTDGTVEVLKRYPHLEWASERDSGQAQAINKGLGRARGEIIGWLNSDDKYCPGAIPGAVAFLSQRRDIDLVYSNCYVINEVGKVAREKRPRAFSYRRQLHIDNLIPQPTVFFRRRILEDVGYLDESLRYALDLDYWLRIGKSHRVAKVEDFFACFRRHGASKTVSESDGFWAEVRRVTRRHGSRFFSRYFFKSVRAKAGKNPFARLVTFLRETWRDFKMGV